MAKVTREQMERFLPDRAEMPGAGLPTREERVEQGYASAMAKARLAEKRRRDEEARRTELAREAGLEILNPEDIPAERIVELADDRKREAAMAEIIAGSPAVIDIVPQETPGEGSAKVPTLSRNKVTQTLALQGAARADVVRLLDSLNINLNVQLTRSDTANLLACLLTCNETQLNALLSNRKVPIVIKTVIRRLLNDVEKGNMGTIDRLWDRVFGKGPLAAGAQEDGAGGGLIPNTPVSREAYMVIRETILK